MPGMNRSGTARARWARIIAEQRASGMTVARFCEARGIASSSFFPWKRRLAQGAQAGGVGSSTTAVFVEAKVPAASAPADAPDAEGDRRGGVGGIAIELVRGRRVLVGRGFDRQLLRDVIEALEAGAGGEA